MTPQPTKHAPATPAVVAAFAAVYLIWGSTYLGIRFAIETLPPFGMSGARFIVAGAVLYAWCRRRGASAPTAIHWRSALIVGGFLLLGANGLVAWSEKVIPSGIACLLVSTLPLWMVLLHAIQPGGTRPNGAEVIGLLLGFGGVYLLIDSGASFGDDGIDRVGAAALLVAPLLWAIGSLYSRRAPLPSSQLLATAMEMLAGGVLMVFVGTLLGEFNGFSIEQVSMRSWIAWGYLVVFGSLVAFSAYMWLLQVCTPARVSTYAYVNPIVAVLLGWAIAGEKTTGRMILAMGVIIAAVVLISTFGKANRSGGS